MIAFALVIMAVSSVLLLSVLTFVTSQIRNASRTEAREQAFQIAESGIDFYKWYIAHGTDGKTAKQIQDFWDSADGVDAPYEAEYVDFSGNAVGRYSITVTPPEPGSTIAWLRSEGFTYRYPDARRVVRVCIRRPSWSENAVVANDVMRFGEGTEVFGKIHSNQGIRFDGYAHNVISSSVASYADPDHHGDDEFGVHTHVNPPPGSGIDNSFRSDEAPPNIVPDRPDVFAAGREFPVPLVDFNGIIGDFNVMKDVAQNGDGLYLSEGGSGVRMYLKTDGTFDVCVMQGSRFKKVTGSGNCNTCSGACVSNYPIPQNSVIFVEGNITLSGQVDGSRVTIVAANLSGSSSTYDVIIPNDILYTNYDGTDTIGVIAQNDIIIPLESEDDLRIDAALLAQQGRVGRPNFGKSDRKSSITVYGAIGTDERYGFAWTNGSEHWGYALRNIYYDNNLLYSPPPYFPSGSQYIVDFWEEL